MAPVSRVLHRPSSQALASHLRQQTRQHHHHRPLLQIHTTLRSKSSFLRTPIATATPSILPSRAFSHSALNMASEPQFAEGVNGSQLQTELNTLLGQGWALDGDGMGVQKTFYFKTYFKAVSFVNVVASQSAAKKHHPTMTVRIGSVDIHWTTHRPRGLTDKDLTMAQHCDEAAELMGAVVQEEGKKCGPSAASTPGV
ncbi:hypothetical protein BBP40_010214 [Aspergillus hancockii]|nr:hypothetical protein BBP40_010214 [Aspergillus hancockii]